MTESPIVHEPKFMVTLLARKSVLGALVAFAAIAAFAALAPVISTVDPAAMSVRNRLSPPFGEWLLGTDAFGRDVFTRLVYAGGVSLSIGLGVALLSSAVGILFGLCAGFFRSLDGTISRIIDAMMAFPDILLAIALVAVLGGSAANILIALSIV